jgi:hypothetical protein
MIKHNMELNNKPNQKELDGFKKIVDEMLALKARKAGDYGQSWKCFGLQGLYSQIGRKFSRIWLNKDKKEVNNEMFRDSLMDMAVYCIMSMQLIDEGETEDLIIKALKGIK